MKGIRALRHKGIKLIILIALLPIFLLPIFLLPFNWFLKHFWILPTIGEDHDLSGFEFRIRF